MIYLICDLEKEVRYALVQLFSDSSNLPDSWEDGDVLVSFLPRSRGLASAGDSLQLSSSANSLVATSV